MASQLKFVSGPHQGKSREIMGDAFLIGRGTDGQLVLDDAEASRRHAILRPQPGGGAVLEDLGSANGTWVDGRRIDGPVTLTGGERIRVGMTEMSFENPDAGRTVVSSAPDFGTGAAQAGAAGAGAAAGAPAAGQAPPGAPTPSRIERMMLRRSVNRAMILAAAAVTVAVVAVVLAVAGVFSGGGEPDPEEIVTAVTPRTLDILNSVEGKGVVSGGTGWVLSAEQGLIVTNNHVINGADRLDVLLEGGPKREAKVVASAPCQDVAVIRVADTDGLESMELGSQKDLKGGETVVAVGFPASASSKDTLISTVGSISAVQTTYDVPRAADVPLLTNVIQTDAAINPGNSGGPLVNLDEKLVGMNTAGLDESSSGRRLQGQGYAIGVDRIKELAPGLAKGASIGWTGLGLEPASPQALSQQGLPSGLLAQNAVPGTPADKAGFGDGGTRLITAVDGKPLDGSLRSYCSIAGKARKGQTAVLTVVTNPGQPAESVRVTFA